MDFIVIPVVAFAASLLTFFSGFGLGTILLPIFAIWFRVDVAVGLTAVVHFLNNIFKLVLVGRHANRDVVIKFGFPAIFAAFAGAAVLVKISDVRPLVVYELFSKNFEITLIKLVIAVLIIVFTLFETLPQLKDLKVKPKYLSLGGILSGFFGGLSGHQGALRSAFLVRAGLNKEGFIATGIVIACFIDVARIGFYSRHFSKEGFSDGVGITAAATLSAFLGAYIGSRILKKITMATIQKVVSVGLLFLAVALGLGII